MSNKKVNKAKTKHVHLHAFGTHCAACIAIPGAFTAPKKRVPKPKPWGKASAFPSLVTHAGGLNLSARSRAKRDRKGA
jgi:hypothetical protein